MIDVAGLADRLGLPLLSFCLAAEPESVRSWIGGEGEPPAGIASVLEQCRVIAAASPPGFAGIRRAFCDLNAETGQPPALDLHLAAGGELPATHGDDEAAVALGALAAATFPTLLLAEPARGAQEAAVKHVESILTSVDPNLQIARHPQMPDTPQIEGSLFPLVLQHPLFGARAMPWAPIRLSVQRSVPARRTV